MPVYVSQKMTNEIVTPYDDPTIIFDDRTGSSVTKVGNIIYVDMDPSGEFLQLLIRDESSSGPSINLFLMPEPDILGNAVTLQVEGHRPAGEEGNLQSYANMPYVDMVRELMRDAVLDRVGSGYTKDELWKDGVPFQVGNLMVRPSSLWKGGKMHIEKWTVINTTGQPVTLAEENFNQDGVRGISFYPKLNLSVNESTQMFRIVDKPSTNRR